MGLSRFKQVIKKFIPSIIKFKLKERKKFKDLYKLNSIPKAKVNIFNLRESSEINVDRILNSVQITKSWNSTKNKIDSLELPEDTGGVNQGDQRALYYLISAFNPTSVLEIGTHIGSSTVYIANALYQKENLTEKKLVTVDIEDVNSQITKPWKYFNSKLSPKEMMEILGFDRLVSFVTNNSIDFFRSNDQKFDVIFLDGSHAGTVVYQEIPFALNSLNHGGIIILHDYFKDQNPLWEGEVAIPGPYLAIKRLINEGAPLEVIPLGELPWITKKNSKYTSLALLLKQKSN